VRRSSWTISWPVFRKQSTGADRQETGHVCRVAEQLAPAGPVVNLQQLIGPAPVKAVCYLLRGAKYCDGCACLSICLFTCPLAYLENHTAELRLILFPPSERSETLADILFLVLSVCLSMCVSVRTQSSAQLFLQIFTSFIKLRGLLVDICTLWAPSSLCMLLLAVARSSSGGVVMCSVLPVLLMTSCFRIIGTVARIFLQLTHGSQTQRYYRTLIGSHTLRIKRNHHRAAPMIGSAQNRVLVPFDFGSRRLTRIRIA